MFKRILSGMFYAIFKVIIGFYVVVFQHVRYNKNGFKIPKGQTVFLSNHQSDWDGLYLEVMFPSRRIRFVVNEEMFKNKFFSFISGNFLRFIRRGTSHTDITLIRNIMKAKNEGSDIGIYPEGDIHFFGQLLHVDDSISKLVKKMKLNVVILKVEGAHLRAPRWSRYPHHGKITYTITDFINGSELENLSIEELHGRIIEGINVDENANQKVNMYKYHGKQHRALWLELGLFMCPKCYKLESMHSHRNIFKCDSCGYEVSLNKYYQFESSEKHFLNTSEWNDWQIEELHKLVDCNPADKALLTATNMDYYQTDFGTFFGKPIDKCDITLYNDRLEIIRYSTFEVETIMYSSIDDYKYQYKDTLEIIVGDVRIRFRTKLIKWSAYLWFETIKYLKINRK